MPPVLDSPLSSAHRRAPPPPLPLAKHDPNRAPRFWHLAVNATKGLFNQPARAILDDDVVAPPVPLVDDRRRRLRKSASTPALKASESTGNLRREMADHVSPPLPSLFTNRSAEHSPRKSKFKAATAHSAVRRPAISAPKPLDSLAFSHPKLAYPLSPTPSPVGSTFSLNTPALRSNLPIHSSQSDVVASVNADAFNGSRPARRRTKSAPGAKLGKRPLLSPALSVAQGSETSMTEPFSPIVFDIASPSIASPEPAGCLPSPQLETPMMSPGYFSHLTSPPVHITSPRSFNSVKRKPVPRYLYTDPPEHDASTPCTPVLTPTPVSPPSASATTARSGDSNSLHAPLLPSSELILKSCNPSRMNSRGLNLLPIGQVRPGSSARRQHRRSVSENGHRRLLIPDGSPGLPSPWFTTNANGSMTPLITPAEEHAPFSFATDLPAAPRIIPHSLCEPPVPIAEEVSVFSDNTSVCSSVSRSGALSPLTDDEIDAIRSFLRRHPTGHRERQRRKACKRREAHSRSTSVASCSYDIHAQILDSYATDEDAFFSLDESEDDADAESHVPMSSSETHSLCSASTNEPRDSFHEGVFDLDVETPVTRDEIETPMDAVNRGTFGYYGTPIVWGPRPHHLSDGACGYVSSDGECDTRPSFPSEWRECEGFGDTYKGVKASNKEGKVSGIQAEEASYECSEGVSGMMLVAGPPRSSSLCCGPSPDHVRQCDDDGVACARISRQPLIPRVLNSDSEGGRPISSSTSVSFSPSTSTGNSTFASGIGLAIIPHEHFAYFDKYAKCEYIPTCSSSDDEAENHFEGSPTTVACASPSLRHQRQCDMKRDDSFDKLQPNLANLRALSISSEDIGTQRNMNILSPMLKPALQISASRAQAATVVQLPSPTDTVATYPPQMYPVSKGYLGQKPVTPDDMTRTGFASVSADEARPDNVKSFMNLTPNDPAPKRSRVKLRQLFSRSNLKGAAGRKVFAESKA